MLMLFAGIPNGAADMGVSLGYCFTITAASFLLWYRPIYNAFMKEMSMYYCKFAHLFSLPTSMPSTAFFFSLLFSPLYYYLSHVVLVIV
jgi:hypothetical protein